jgi:hypothetical protein
VAAAAGLAVGLVDLVGAAAGSEDLAAAGAVEAALGDPGRLVARGWWLFVCKR